MPQLAVRATLPNQGSLKAVVTWRSAQVSCTRGQSVTIKKSTLFGAVAVLVLVAGCTPATLTLHLYNGATPLTVAVPAEVRRTATVDRGSISRMNVLRP